MPASKVPALAWPVKKVIASNPAVFIPVCMSIPRIIVERRVALKGCVILYSGSQEGERQRQSCALI
jgi:hypothetical protein